MSLGALTIDIAANLARLTSDLGEASNRLDKWAKQSQKLLGSLAIGFGVNEFREFIASNIDAADAASKAAQKIGISTESYSALAYAAKLADIESQEFTASMVKLDKAIVEAGEGSKKQAAAFSDLGISVKNTDGSLKGADAILLQIADKFASTKDGATKTAIALDLFGKSGAQMIPLLNGGAASLEELKNQAAELGIVISTDAGKAAETFNDNVTVMQARASGLGMAIANDLLPTLINVTEAINAMNATGDAGVGTALAFSLKVLASVGAEVSLTFRDIGDGIGAFAAAANAAAHGGFKEAGQILDESTRRRDEMIAQTDAFLDRVWGDPAKAAIKSAATQINALDRTAAAQLDAAEKAQKADEKRGEKIAQLVSALEREAATVGDTTAQNKLYELAQLGATDADIRRASAAQAVIDAYIAQQEVYKGQIETLDRMGSLRAEALSPELRALEELRAKYSEIDEARNAKNPLISQDEADQTKKGLGDNLLSDIDTYLQTDEEKLAASYERRQEMLDGALEAGLVSEERYNKLAVKLHDKQIAEIAALEAQKKHVLLSNAASVADALAGMAEITAGKQSGIYKAMFAASKAFAIADAIVKIQAGIASAASVAWPANLGAMASVIAATGSIVSTIQSTNMGQAHAGLENVPQDATYMLKNGERVLAPAQNRDLTNFLSQRQSAAAPTQININVHGVTDADSFRKSQRQIAAEMRAALG